MIGNEHHFFELYRGNSGAVLSFFSSFIPGFICLVFLLPPLPPAMLCSVSYWVQHATIWTVNVVSVTAKLSYTLLALCFLNHDHHYHYR